MPLTHYIHLTSYNPSTDTLHTSDTLQSTHTLYIFVFSYNIPPTGDDRDYRLLSSSDLESRRSSSGNRESLPLPCLPVASDERNPRPSTSGGRDDSAGSADSPSVIYMHTSHHMPDDWAASTEHDANKSVMSIHDSPQFMHTDETQSSLPRKRNKSYVKALPDPKRILTSEESDTRMAYSSHDVSVPSVVADVPLKPTGKKKTQRRLKKSISRQSKESMTRSRSDGHIETLSGQISNLDINVSLHDSTPTALVVHASESISSESQIIGSSEDKRAAEIVV